jgi:hypothetical protein
MTARNGEIRMFQRVPPELFKWKRQLLADVLFRLTDNPGGWNELIS